MEELIKIYKQKDGSDVASARELHSYLESKQDFSDWIKKRIEKYEFIENQDYSSFHKIMEREKGGSTRIEYAITLDMAKELSMVEGNAKGKLARKYFIACEKKLKEVASGFQIPKTYAEAMQVAATLALKVEDQSKQIEADKPKVAFADAVSTSETDILMRDLAKLIAQNGYVIGEHRLYAWMVDHHFLEARKRWSAKKSRYETQYWPTQRAIDLKVFRVKETIIHEGSTSAFLKPTVKVNGKGQQFFINKFISAQ